MQLKHGLTIAICTYNSADRLAKCINAVLNQNYIHDNWELLIIDNNSNDGTNQVISTYVKNIPKVRCLVEEQQGIAYARKRAILEAKFKYLSFIDDDCIVFDNWVKEILEHFSKHQQTGMISSILSIPKDYNVPAHFKWSKGWYAIGPKYEPINEIQDNSKQRVYWTAGLSLDITILKEAMSLGLDFCLSGRSKNTKLGGEDLELSMWMNILGYSSIVTDKTGAIHEFGQKRLDFLYILEVSSGGGYGQLILELYRKKFKSKNTNKLLIQVHYLWEFILSYFKLQNKLIRSDALNIQYNLISYYRNRNRFQGSFKLKHLIPKLNKNLSILDQFNNHLNKF